MPNEPKASTCGEDAIREPNRYEEPAAEDEPPRLRRLVRTLRQLDDRQLAAIGSVARSYVQSPEDEPETP